MKRIRVMKRKKGIRFRAEIRIKGKRYSKTLESEEAASKWISMHESLKMGGSGSNQYERKMTLGQALLFSFEIAQERGLDERTIGDYRRQIEHFHPILDVEISKLTAKELVDAFKTIRHKRTGGIVSKSYLNAILYRLVESMNKAARKGFVMDDFDVAVAHIETYIKNHGKDKGETILYTEEELARLLEDKRAHPLEAYWVLPIIKILVFSGKRFGEVHALCNQDIDHVRNRIHIWKMITGFHFHDHLKGHGAPHYIEMDQTLKNVVRDLQEENKKRGIESAWLFVSNERGSKEDYPAKDKCPFKGKPISQPTIVRAIHRRMKRLGLRRIKIHDFRKLYGTYRLIQLLREGNPFAWMIVQRELNHKSVKTTEGYINMPEDLLLDKAKVNPLAHVIGGKFAQESGSVSNIDALFSSLGLEAADIDWELLKQLLSTFSKLQKKAA